jgi:hypothetical protein
MMIAVRGWSLALVIAVATLAAGASPSGAVVKSSTPVPTVGHATPWRHAAPIPAFARMYRTACSTCHTAAPKLNVLGEAFRLNGYEMPQTRLLERADEPVPLGAPVHLARDPSGASPPGTTRPE